MIDDFGFGPACEGEQTVFGSQGPDSDGVQEWISFMKDNGIKRVCCLLPQSQLSECDGDLLDTYHREFGEDEVCWAPIEDFQLADSETLKKILRFLQESDARGKRVVVHCYAGLGRTGQVLAAWLVFKYGLSPEYAVEAVIKMGRNPCTAVESGNATMEQLYALLGQCRWDGRA